LDALQTAALLYALDEEAIFSLRNPGMSRPR